MQFLCVVRRRTEAFSEEQFNDLLESEAQRLRELYALGKVRSAWSREDTLGACLLLECADAADAQEVVNSLPLAQKGMLEIQIIPLRGYRGFGPR